MPTQAPHQIALTVGRNIRAARDAQGMTQRQVGDAVGATNRDVSRWESGKVEPGLHYRLALADALFDGEVAALYREPEAATA